jgi:hypothetical protein
LGERREVSKGEYCHSWEHQRLPSRRATKTERLVKFYSVDPKVGRPLARTASQWPGNKLRVACGPVRLSLERSYDVAVECSQLIPATFDDDSSVFLFESQFKSSMAGTIK